MKHNFLGNHIQIQPSNKNLTESLTSNYLKNLTNLKILKRRIKIPKNATILFSKQEKTYLKIYAYLKFKT